MLHNEYIYQEIQEQLELIRIHHNAPKISIPKIKGKIIITGSGDSHCASQFGEWLLKDKFNVIALPSMDALQYSLSKNDVVIGISVSGRTNRIIEIFKLAKKVGAYKIAITDNANSPASQLADETWLFYASPQEELKHSSYKLKEAKEYIGYHHDVAQTKTFWAVLLTLIRASQIKINWNIIYNNTKKLLSENFYKPLIDKAKNWAKSHQSFFLGTYPFDTLTQFAAYKMYEYNLIAHFSDIEEYCHTQYFITRKNDNIIFLSHNKLALKRAFEIIPTIKKLFSANIILIKYEDIKMDLPKGITKNKITIINLPTTKNPIIQFLEMVIAIEWLTYFIGRINAKNINTFHAGFNTEQLVQGSYHTIRKSSLID